MTPAQQITLAVGDWSRNSPPPAVKAARILVAATQTNNLDRSPDANEGKPDDSSP